MRMMLIAAMLLGGCATMIEEDAGTPAPTPSLEGKCQTEALSALVGEAATAELGAEALRLSQARTVRWIPPGQAVTMDYRPDRLNIRLDDKNVVQSFDCG